MKSKRATYNRAYYIEHKDRILMRVKRYKLTHPAKVVTWRRKNRRTHKDTIRSGHLRRKYGITLEQYNQMLYKQNGVCAICKRLETRKFRGTLVSLAVDHDHKTGRIRSLLCSGCNALVGMAESKLKAVIKYLSMRGIR